ncbi:SGNH hydrolase-type esterase domain-containing protein [Gloeopeniophorella convolvens]|nr:SGNH hydrolase-type esterase domain-containing protein [Gloeopeniophorella convolvens]
MFLAPCLRPFIPRPLSRPRIMAELLPSLAPFRRAGRWAETGSGSLVASWASASVSFILTSSRLSIRIGPKTQRKDSFNGNSVMIICTVSDPADPWKHSRVLPFEDVNPGELVVLDRSTDKRPKLVEISLVDWSSVFELSAIIVDSADAVQARTDPEPPARLLFIGDSISCGFSSLPRLIPQGSFDAFTTRAAMHLRVPSTIVAYPGITLVEPKDAGPRFSSREPGMASRFFLAGSSPSDTTTAPLDERPTIIVIALGTNDRGLGVKPQVFAQTLRAFITRLAETYHGTLAHVCIIHPFPFFGRGPTISNAIAEGLARVAAEVSAKHFTLGVHVWDLGGELTKKTTMDALHPTLEGHTVLGEALAERLRPLLHSLGD